MRICRAVLKKLKGIRQGNLREAMNPVQFTKYVSVHFVHEYAEYRAAMSESALHKVWDNQEDDVCHGTNNNTAKNH